MIYTIDVTEADICKGYPGTPSKCPVALACKRALDRTTCLVTRVSVFPGGVFGERVPLPELVTEWIDRFDRERNVEPFTFTLEVP